MTKYLSVLQLVVFSFILTSLISCEAGVEPEINNFSIPKDTLKSTTHFLWPMKKGNYWNYKHYEINRDNYDTTWKYENFSSFGFNLDTMVHNLDYRYEIVDSLLITTKDTVFECFSFDTYYYEINKYQDFRVAYWIDESGIYSMGAYSKHDSLFNKDLYIPSNVPLDVGWNSQLLYRINNKFYTEDVIEKSCISKSEIISTPFGDLVCYVIRTETKVVQDVAGSYVTFEYYSPSIGKICQLRIRIWGQYNHQFTLEFVDILNAYSVN